MCMQRYDQKFYDDLSGTALPSARRIVPLLQDMMQIDSVVDVGCGNGSWLSVFQELGVARILGVDGDWIETERLLIPTDCFRRVRLEHELGIGEHFDLAVSLEVAEHLPADRADSFVADLCQMAPVILFSAAVPYQGGLNHVNEQWPDYWAKHFARRGYRPIDTIRLAVWGDPAVTWWYKQNLLMFANDKALAQNEKLAKAHEATSQPLLSLVHPDRYEMMARDVTPSLGKWLRRGTQAFRASMAKRKRR
jgi:SAM-dependent methyltransferase